jgi:site-specific DNA-methyltransferase (adenine-specific)
MKVAFKDDLVTLYQGDCLGALSLCADADVVLADPPYGDTSLQWDVQVRGWPSAIAAACKRSTSLWCFGSLRMFMSCVADFADWSMSQEIVWEKHNGSSFHNDRFKRVHELAVMFYRVGTPWADVYHNPVHIMDATKRTVRRKQRPPHTGHTETGSYTSEDGGPRLMRSVLKVRSCHGFGVHPTQKPEGIIEPLLQYSCPDGGLVFDPFAGSGTSLAVARRLGMRAVGVEIDPAHCEAARERLGQCVLPLHGVQQSEVSDGTSANTGKPPVGTSGCA